MKGKTEVAELFMSNMLRFQDHPPADHHFQEQREQRNCTQDPEKGGDCHVDDTVPSQEPMMRASLGELSSVAVLEEEEDENDGFRTPTSSEHKIPAITQCPPAPRKPTATRAIAMKRRPTTSKVSRRLQFHDQFDQVLNIPPIILASFLSSVVKPPRDGRK